ncbi:outer membrane protein assembly factor BamE [Pseudoduganella namucuonensis]|uniref:outer membrane protein assembly factor BamE n=1 Tax=Pseudoduganella namucuonensis TaxID=1035707 RepID=UPI0011601459|nr:outer membrane protein assembly factor BamE [Pseudoduganella namucuonensis]
MNIHFEIDARMGVGPILFGMTQADVHKLLGEPDWFDSSREEYLQGFIIRYDEAQLVEFIELAKSELFSATFRGKNLHALIAEEAISFMSQFDRFDENDVELGYSYIFPMLDLSLWRSTIPDSGSDPDGQYFEAIGLGKEGYFTPK